jgi:hypothetical protein
MFILGIHLDPPYVLGALIQKNREGIKIHALRSAFLYEPDNVKQLYIASERPFKGKIASGISAKDFLIRSLELKIANHRHIEEAIAFQAEATSHLNPKEILTVHRLRKNEKGNTEALLFTAPREALKQHLIKLEALQIDPDAVSAIPEALCQFARWKFPHLLDAFIIDLGSHEWTCAWMEKGQLKKAHVIAGGVEALLEALLEDRKKILLKKEIEGAAKQIDLLLLKSGLNPHLTEKLNEMRQELSKIHYSFQRGAEKKAILFTGRTNAFIHLSEFLIDASENPFSLSLEEQKFAPALGLALTQTNSHPLQFRQGEFFPQKNWRKLGLYALSLITFSLLGCGILFYFGSRSIQSRKKEMANSLKPSLQKGKFSSEGSNAEERIVRWISAVEASNKEYPYILQAPKAAEVLAWFSSHPLLEKFKNEGDPIELREIRYQLVQFPKIGSPKEPYLAKVEIEFQFKNATNGRKFHEALREGDNRVDPRLDVTWDVLHDGYRASFFLKNRSPYVP